jgi:hypothetical protein
MMEYWSDVMQDDCCHVSEWLLDHYRSSISHYRSSISRNALASGSVASNTKQPGASARRLMDEYAVYQQMMEYWSDVMQDDCCHVSEWLLDHYRSSISRNALASGSVGHFVQLMSRQMHPIFCFAHVQNHRFQIVVAIDALPITQRRPNGSITKLVPLIAQSARGVGFKLIANLVAGIARRCHYGVNMIFTSRFRPQFPPANFAMTFNFLFDDRLLRVIEKLDGMFPSVASPVSKFRLRQLFAFTPSSPTADVTLQKSSINRPCDEIGKRIVVIHRLVPPFE